MANTIKIKQSAEEDKVPLAADLQQGELAINTFDEKLYTKNSSGTVVHLNAGGSGGSSVTVVDDLTSTSTTSALSANQGRVLKGDVDGKLASNHAASGVTTNKIDNWDGASTHAGLPHAPSGAQANRSISDLTSTTSSVISASSTAVKAAYDVGNHTHPYLPTAGGTLTGDLSITGASPQVKLLDSDASADDFHLHANSNNFYVLTDRNDDGDFADADEWAPPLILQNETQDALLYGAKIWDDSRLGFSLNGTVLTITTS